MAEGLLKARSGDRLDVWSAGTSPSGTRPEAIPVLAEIGIDISGNRSKSVDEFSGRQIDFVLTVCSDAQANCPYFPNSTIPQLLWAAKKRGCRPFVERDEIAAYIETDLDEVITGTRQIKFDHSTGVGERRPDTRRTASG